MRGKHKTPEIEVLEDDKIQREPKLKRRVERIKAKSQKTKAQDRPRLDQTPKTPSNLSEREREGRNRQREEKRSRRGGELYRGRNWRKEGKGMAKL